MRACRAVTMVFTALYALALGAFVAGSFGLFGAERDPLAGVFLVPLGLPWNRLVDLAPEPLWPWLAAAAPVLNLVVLWFVCRAITASEHRTKR